MKNSENWIPRIFPITIGANRKGEINAELGKEYTEMAGYAFSAAENATYNGLKTAKLSKDLNFGRNNLMAEQDLPLRFLMADEVCPGPCKGYEWHVEGIQDQTITGEIEFTDPTLTYPLTVQMIILVRNFVKPGSKEIPC